MRSTSRPNGLIRRNARVHFNLGEPDLRPFSVREIIPESPIRDQLLAEIEG